MTVISYSSLFFLVHNGTKKHNVYFIFILMTVVQQFYDVDVNKEYVIRGNSVILKCQIPSFVADFVSVVSWHTDQNENFFPGSPDGTLQTYIVQIPIFFLQSYSSPTKPK